MDYLPAPTGFTEFTRWIKNARWLYRVSQFWNAISAQPLAADLELARTVLTQPLYALFMQMQKDEQSHSLKMLRSLLHQGENNADLFVAVLLHDSGKIRFPLHVWERIVIVLAKLVFPQQIAKWGRMPLAGDKMSGLRRPFVVAEQHSHWGAELAAQAGASELATNLIRRHQEKHSLYNTKPVSCCASNPGHQILSEDALEDALLTRLQSVDEQY
jgi:hypothetical protein